MSKKILLLAVSVCLPNTLFASDLEVKVGGSIDTQYGIIDQKKDFRVQKPGDKDSKKLSQHGLVNNNSITVEVNKKGKDSLEYGGYIKLNANTSKTSSGKDQIADKTYFYMQGNLGRMEVGATKSSNENLRITGYSVARATGGFDGSWFDWIRYGAIDPQDNEVGKDLKPLFLAGTSLPGDLHKSKANRLNYYTPKLNGFTFGVSYVPDMNVQGTVNKLGDLHNRIGGGYKDVIQPGVRYEYEMKDVKFTASVISEFGKSKDHVFSDEENPMKRKKLSSYAIGSGIEYKGFAITGEYGDWGKSGTPKTQEAGCKYGASYWTLGSAYSEDNFGISVNYMESKKAGGTVGKDDKSLLAYVNEKHYNRFNAFIVGADYKVAEGLMPYIEFTRFKYDRNKNPGKGNKGSLILAGTKLKF